MHIFHPPACVGKCLDRVSRRQFASPATLFGLHRAEPDNGVLFFGEQSKQEVERVVEEAAGARFRRTTAAAVSILF